MYVQFGNFTHQLDGVGLAIQKQGLLNRAGVQYAIRHRWVLNGMLTADSLSEMDALISSLESAYATGGKDMKLLDNSLSATNTQVLNSNTIGGTRVVQPPSYPDWKGAEYVTIRKFTVVLEADVRTSTTESTILVWTENLTFTGGGPREVYIELRNGPPQRQLISQSTPSFMTQSGQSIGLFSYLPYPPPLLQNFEDLPARQLGQKLPKTMGRANYRTQLEYERSWSYRFHAPSSLLGASSQPQPTSGGG